MVPALRNIAEASYQGIMVKRSWLFWKETGLRTDVYYQLGQLLESIDNEHEPGMYNIYQIRNSSRRLIARYAQGGRGIEWLARDSV